jgi:hypothetical protein
MPVDRHFDRLVQCVTWSRNQQGDYRDLNRTLIDAAMGDQYPRQGAEAPETVINLLWMTQRAMSRFLYMHAPRALANTQVREWKSFSEDAEIALNETIKKSDFEGIISSVIDQALYSVGGLFMSADYVGTPEGMRQKLVIEDIPFPDLVWDAGARDIQKSDYLGRLIEMKTIDVRDHPLFDEEARGKVQASRRNFGEGSAERADFYSQASGFQTDLYDYTRLFQVYDQPSGRMYVWPENQQELKLQDSVWSGPEHGPVRVLHFGTPPGHAYPSSPMQNFFRLARARNTLAVKALQQEQVAKGVLAYTSASKDEAERVANSLDNQTTLKEHGGLRYEHIGGASPGTVAMSQMAQEMFSYAVGNLDQLLGTGPQAPTATQERMLNDSTTANMREMGHIVYAFIKAVVEDAYWFNLRDGETRKALTKRLGRQGLTYRVAWTPEKRQMIRKMRFQVDVEPYSYRPRTPDGRLADVLQSLQVLMSMQPHMMAQGMTIDVEAIARLLAKYKDIPELYDALILNQSPDQLSKLLGPREGKAPGEAMGGPQPRHYIRESRSDGAAENVELLRMMQGSGGTAEAA